MAKTFSIETETYPVSDFDFRGNQGAKAEIHGCERVFRFREIKGDVSRLPLYIKSAIADAGFKPVYLGGTTYKYSVVGLVAL